MNLADLRKIKKTYNLTLSKLVSGLYGCLDNPNLLYKQLNDIEEVIDSIHMVDRVLNKFYVSVQVSETESVYDLISYVEGLSKKIKVLSELIPSSCERSTLTEYCPSLDFRSILKSIDKYNDLKGILLDKINSVCKDTLVEDIDI